MANTLDSCASGSSVPQYRSDLQMTMVTTNALIAEEDEIKHVEHEASNKSLRASNSTPCAHLKNQTDTSSSASEVSPTSGIPDEEVAIVT